MPVITIRLGSAAIVATLAVTSFALAELTAAGQKVPGDLWETSVQMAMSMPGAPAMSMPEQTAQSCRAKNSDWREAPMPKEAGCQTRDFKLVGTKATWNMTCEGFTGPGEITFSGNSYSGRMSLKAPMGEMVMNMKGRRVGDCEAAQAVAAAPQTVPAPARAKSQPQAAARAASAGENAATTAVTQQMQQMCGDFAKKGFVEPFLGREAPCSGPVAKSQFCAALSTAEAYARVDKSKKLTDAAAFCGKQPEAVRREACASAVKNPEYDLLLEQCPAEAKVVAQEKCVASRVPSELGKYSNLPPHLEEFCEKYDQNRR